MSKDKNGGGTDGDGEKSNLYCSYCYTAGEFVEPELTLEDMQRKLTVVLKRMKSKSLMIKLVMRRLPKLKRWREQAKATRK